MLRTPGRPCEVSPSGLGGHPAVLRSRQLGLGDPDRLADAETGIERGPNREKK